MRISDWSSDVCSSDLMAGHAQVQGLDALQDLEGIGRRQAGTEIAQALGARPHDEGAGAEFFDEVEAVIAGVGLGQGQELARCFPVEARSEARRVGKEGVSPCRSRWAPAN